MDKSQATAVQVYSLKQPLTWKGYMLGQALSTIYLSHTIDNATQEVKGTIEDLGDSIGQSFSELGASFQYGMALMSDKLRAQTGAIEALCDKVGQLQQVMETPLQTKAREWRTIGIQRMTKGLFDKALEAFQKSLELYDTDFFVHLQVGKLSLYAVSEDYDLIDLDRAERHLRNAGRFALAEGDSLPETRSLAAEAYFHAGIACLAQGKQLLDQKKIEDGQGKYRACQMLMLKVVNQMEGHKEALFHLAKCSGVLGNKLDALQFATRACEMDPGYFGKISQDSDLEGIHQDTKALLVEWQTSGKLAEVEARIHDEIIRREATKMEVIKQQEEQEKRTQERWANPNERDLCDLIRHCHPYFKTQIDTYGHTAGYERAKIPRHEWDEWAKQEGIDHTYFIRNPVNTVHSIVVNYRVASDYVFMTALSEDWRERLNKMLS